MDVVERHAPALADRPQTVPKTTSEVVNLVLLNFGRGHGHRCRSLSSVNGSHEMYPCMTLMSGTFADFSGARHADDRLADPDECRFPLVEGVTVGAADDQTAVTKDLAR